MKITKKSWPILIVSNQFQNQNDESLRLKELVNELENVYLCKVLPCLSYDDAAELMQSRQDFGAIVIDWDINRNNPKEPSSPSVLLSKIRFKNANIPVFLLTDWIETGDIPIDVMNSLSGCLWKTSDSIEFVAGKIEKYLFKYVRDLYPPFFGMLVKYAEEFKYSWHTPGHMGGTGFLRSPVGTAMYKFFGENTFRSDLSISVSELGSLLDHSGVVGESERNSARAFGADYTYYVLNGTSNVNQVIWRSQIVQDGIALVDRNCHKSVNYAMVITGSHPIYMVPRRNKLGIMGPVKLSEFTDESIIAKKKLSELIPDELKENPIDIAALTNSTYDGVCYNVSKIRSVLGNQIKNLHFDEAWFAYARFHKMYEDFYGMCEIKTDNPQPPTFVGQSTHKMLTAFSQASMLHIKDGSASKINHDEFNESYMMHASTSPQYNMIASLDVATKMMQDNGESLMCEIIKIAVMLRRNVAKISREIKNRDTSDWFFDIWQPKEVNIEGKVSRFEEADINYLISNQSVWVMNKKDNWHGFSDIEDDYAMLDPIKLTFITPGLDENGDVAEFGIPAVVVTNFLMTEGIVGEKTDYYSFLMLNSLGTTKAKQETLLTSLLRFKRLHDIDAPLSEVLPDLVDKYPQHYKGKGLKEHCNDLHQYIKKHNLLAKMLKAFGNLPTQSMNPSDAYKQVVKKNVEFVEYDKIDNRIPAVMSVPYPPGIPIVMGGERMDEASILDYLRARQDFEIAFPGYESDIHGIERTEDKKFKTMCVKDK